MSINCMVVGIAKKFFGRPGAAEHCANPVTALAFSCIVLLLGVATPSIAAPDKSVDEVIASGCAPIPDNFTIKEFWADRMGVPDAWCDYPAITQGDIGERRKPRVYANGSINTQHDATAAKSVNGTGENGDTLGVAPRTVVSLDLYCSDTGPLAADAQPGDVVFSLRVWNDFCRILDPALPTIPVYAIDNEDRRIRNGDRDLDAILISSGGNWGKIDYFSPGDARTELGGGNVSFALPQFAGIVTALNAALISQNRPLLTRDTIKDVLNASSDEVYLEVNGNKGIYKENQLSGLSSYKYYGQLVNLSEAIAYVLRGSVPRTYLTVINKVVNIHGGNALATDFDLRVNGGDYNGTIARFTGEWLEIEHGQTYILGVDLLPGYEVLGNVQCTDDDTGATVTHPVNLGPGQSATCTITVDDVAPQITIVKHVTNEDEGTLVETDFTLYLSGKGVNSKTKRLTGETITVESNTPYRVSEKPEPGYSQTGIACVDDTTRGSVPHPVVLDEGQKVSCTISNIDKEDSSMYVIPVRNGGAVIFSL